MLGAGLTLVYYTKWPKILGGPKLHFALFCAFFYQLIDPHDCKAFAGIGCRVAMPLGWRPQRANSEHIGDLGRVVDVRQLSLG